MKINIWNLNKSDKPSLNLHPLYFIRYSLLWVLVNFSSAKHDVNFSSTKI